MWILLVFALFPFVLYFCRNSSPSRSECVGISELRNSSKMDLPEQVEELRKEIGRLIPDARARERVIQHARDKYPDLSEAKVFADLIERLRNERR